jgi:hypothetical protein
VIFSNSTFTKSYCIKQINFIKMKKLTRDEMKNVVGGVEAAGGSCCWHTADWSEYECGISKADAQGGSSGGNGMWCCASCAQSQLNAGV